MYIHEQVDLRLENPQDDLLTGLTYAEEEGDKLSREELLSMVFLLLAAGHETTSNLIGNGMVALLTNPEQMDHLKRNIDDQDLLKTMVEEILRHNGPAPSTLLRFAFEDVEIRGKTIKRGDGVLYQFALSKTVTPKCSLILISLTSGAHPISIWGLVAASTSAWVHRSPELKVQWQFRH